MSANESGTAREIYLAGGCFWGAQGYLRRLPGVLETEVGYANSVESNPTYEQVCSGSTEAAETVRVVYDADKLALPLLLQAYFASINPTNVNHQGNDVGTQYRTGIYWVNDEDEAVARHELDELQTVCDAPVAVEAMALENFYPADTVHQDYLIKHPCGYCHIDLNLADRFAAEHGLALND